MTKKKTPKPNHLRKPYILILRFQFCLRYEEIHGSIADFILITVQVHPEKSNMDEMPYGFYHPKVVIF